MFPSTWIVVPASVDCCSWWGGILGTFVSLPKEVSIEIRNNFKCLEEGWGRMKVTAKVGNSEWQTAIWFDTKQDTYLLPLKATIRKKENIVLDKDIDITISI
jgi:hypothetical protein